MEKGRGLSSVDGHKYYYPKPQWMQGGALVARQGLRILANYNLNHRSFIIIISTTCLLILKISKPSTFLRGHHSPQH